MRLPVVRKSLLTTGNIRKGVLHDGLSIRRTIKTLIKTAGVNSGRRPLSTPPMGREKVIELVLGSSLGVNHIRITFLS